MPGVYLSYPFCAQKCTYCNFASGVFPRELQPRYLDRLRREIEQTAWQWRPETVYWGGGTPSLIEGDDFARVMEAIPGKPWREATLEAAPGTLTRERVTAWREAGINRLSLGVQSFVELEIRRTGRKHTAETVADDVALARDCGMGQISIDLIAGLAGQTEASWEQSLDHLLRLQPDHVSVYMLEVDEDSRLGQEMLLGGVRYGAMDVPDEAAITRFYERAVSRLADAGLARYEISNFARSGAESLHNLKYWRREPYLGFGADAHSFDGRMRWANADSPLAYVEAADPVIERTEAIPEQEALFLGLRLAEGIPESLLPHHRLEDLGLMERAGGRLRLTARGILLSNDVFQEFVA